MDKNKRRVVLALIAFFCTAAATYVSVDWKRVGSGVLAFFKNKDDKPDAVASGGGTAGGSAHSIDPAPAPTQHASLPETSAPGPTPAHKHVASGGGGKSSGDDLFTFGDPAAGKPGNFLVASNDPPPNIPATMGEVPRPGTGTPSPMAQPAAAGGGGGGGDGGGYSAPNPSSTGSSGDGVFPTTPAPSTPSAPTPTTVSPNPPANSPPTQSGSTDTNSPPPADTGTGTGGTPSTGGTPTEGGTPTDGTPSSPVSSVPEASSAAMMTLAALFVAAAAQAQRRRKEQETH